MLFLTAREGDLLLVDGDRRADEEGSDVLGQSFVQTALKKLLNNLGARLFDVTIIMEVFDVLVVGNVSADSGVSGFADVIS